MGKNGKESVSNSKKKKADMVEEIITEVTTKGKSLLNDGWDNARQIIEDNKDALKVKAGEFSDKTVEEISEDVKHYVRQSPLKSLAIAVGAGFLLGFVLKSD